MKQRKINGHLFANMIRQGAKNLEKHAKNVDALNVFPVPDGDTGTNMSLSLASGVNEMNKVSSNSVAQVAKALSKGLLMGARGNSGVILSQLFRGFAKGVESKEHLIAQDFAAGLKQGVETAYKAVMKPVEGTILTVAKDAAKVAEEKAKQTDNLLELMEAVVAEAKASLMRTPDLLPILKQVGVVDSGGQGLVYVYEGFLAALRGEIDTDEAVSTDESVPKAFSENKEVHVQNEVAEMMAQGVLSEDDIKYGYCTEFMIRLDQNQTRSFQESEFRRQLHTYGDSILVVSDDELVKVHIHAEELGKVLGYAQSFGELTNIKIENMREQFREVKERGKGAGQPSVPHVDLPSATEKNYGIVAVGMGDGIAEIFKSLGADEVIYGGQTMNPSTQAFVDVMESIRAKQVIILPNNSNVILTAQQAAQLVDKQVAVISTQNVMQGIAALLSFNPSVSLEENVQAMSKATEGVVTGQVTHATRDTELDGITIKKGHYIGIKDGKIVVTAEKADDALRQLIGRMISAESEILTLIYGEDVDKAEIEAFQAFMEDNYPDVEIEVHSGKQPLYPYLVSVE
ncbi:DAK2 domain fusion protein YloV [Caldalkalibacillus thermarum TA2.A1]|uniref:DAK2 domain fusion protein YloV n=1 Tax=Caldalkalibacillus thermarum (strain TA2.A1) TaxID=986075 RepID=F5L7T9_CALTT|nr:DAK2 domain-containing protein [Caldalkalibacillus thermarum]EGL82598.1 DAK2 domain fusion protein YloV [Caldalkalibacillus thermarum TA2.A1]QZT32807.1 DAK2 domain-containing protein [Caldalkalibacillus thermarum TA2.A1]